MPGPSAADDRQSQASARHHHTNPQSRSHDLYAVSQIRAVNAALNYTLEEKPHNHAEIA